ncbi:hypothetical protein EH164_06450 [Kosakonia sp. CCTCC M2018092]|nr:hypothetical protein EH164_06450 [Kosakonia sp. CCTCC M2018092]
MFIRLSGTQFFGCSNYASSFSLADYFFACGLFFRLPLDSGNLIRLCSEQAAYAATSLGRSGR